jgi:putative YhbY family RNA-binding protein
MTARYTHRMKLELSADQTRALRADAHHLAPVVMIGNDGLTPAVLHEIDVNLAAHGLIKIRVFGDDRDARDEILSRIADQLDAAPVQHIGKLLIIYRPLPEPEAAPRTKRAPATATYLSRTGARRTTQRSGAAAPSSRQRKPADARQREERAASRKRPPAPAPRKRPDESASRTRPAPPAPRTRPDESAPRKRPEEPASRKHPEESAPRRRPDEPGSHAPGIPGRRRRRA